MATPSTSTHVYYATGRRKESVAKVWLFPGEKGFTINGLEPFQYLKRETLHRRVEAPLRQTNLLDQFRIRAKVEGGGVSGQSGAISLGISRALLQHDGNLRSALRRGGFLSRDPREKERKKFGHKGARKSFQYTKR